MLFQHIILILLYWPCIRGASNDSSEYIIDQIATASENLAPQSSKPPRNSSESLQKHNKDSSYNFISNWENDPAFSTEARYLLTIPQYSRPIRRSFDVNEGQKEFEILKVNNKTPAIANYHEFYENLQNNLRTSSSTWPNDPNGNTAPKKTKERIRLIDEYFDYNSERQTADLPNYAFQNYPKPTTQKDTIQQSSVFEPAKVNNYPQYAPTNYQMFEESAVKAPQRSNLPQKIQSKRVNSKPVIIADLNNYNGNANYNIHQPITRTSTSDPYLTTSEDRYDRKEDYSDESSEYLEITERPKRQKHRRRPESSRKPQKDQKNDDEGKKMTSSRVKTRSRSKQNYWNNENQQNFEDSSEEKHGEPLNRPENTNQNSYKQNTWSQVAPNVEYSPSNSYELNPADNSKLLVPVNLVPITHFDHATALGNSQGFDVSNAGHPNVVTASPMVTSTASPLMNPNPTILSPHLMPQNPGKSYGYPNTVSDIIVGQNSYQNPVQAVLLPQINVQKYGSKPQYIASTMAPMFSFTQSLSPIQSVQSTQSPRITTPGNQYGPQVFFPQSTLQTLLQTPVNPQANYNIFVNTRGPQSQVKPTPPSITNSNHGTVTPERKKPFNGNNGQILTSASFSVSQDGNHHANHGNLQNINNNQLSNSNYYQNQNNQILRETQVVPAYIQAPNGISAVNLINQNPLPKNQNPQVVNVANNIFENTWRQLHQLENDASKNIVRYPNVYGIDSLGSTSNNNVNTANNIKTDGFIKQAQLPVVGMQTVEIINPNMNIKPSPIDLTMMNPLETINYPAAVLTTPIPILSTTGFLTPRPVVTTTPESISIQSYVDSLTQIGSQNAQGTDLKEVHQSGPLAFNPMNFVPNWDLIRSQELLNSKSHVPKPLPKHLNLIPFIPGGNFEKHSPTAQLDLINKPKLSSDLEKYAEEMFKESLRTIYNSHKWNSDKKNRTFTETDIAELEKIKNDLGKLKAMISSNHNKEILEAHHSETNIRTAEPGRDHKNTGISVSELEQLFKSNFKGNENSHSTKNIKINDYLTPPKPNSHVSTSSYADKPGKKRPGKGHRHENIKSRPYSRPITRPNTLDTSASNHVVYSRRRPYHDRSNTYNDHKKTFKLDNYVTFTTSSPNSDPYQVEEESQKREYFDTNQPRTHNLLGMLMKNKKLPNGPSHYFSDTEIQEYLEDERRKAEAQFYDEFQSFHKKSDYEINHFH